MKWRVLAIGKPKLAYAKAGVEEYARRIQPFASVALEFLKNAGDQDDALLFRSKGAFRIVLDERGEELSSRELAREIGTWEQRSVSNIALLIGGAGGHSDAVRATGDWRWSLSRLTLQHELALVVALEQIYRAYTIKSGLPYHRD